MSSVSLPALILGHLNKFNGTEAFEPIEASDESEFGLSKRPQKIFQVAPQGPTLHVNL